jgi:hypothetical protein
VGSKELLEGTLQHQGFGCNLSFYYLIQMHLSFLYESYLFILYDSLITYIVSYQIFLVLFLSSLACVPLHIFLHKPREELGLHWQSQIFNI